MPLIPQINPESNTIANHILITLIKPEQSKINHTQLTIEQKWLKISNP